MNEFSQSDENVSARYPELAKYKKMHAEVEAMKPATITCCLLFAGAALTGGDIRSSLIVIATALVWGLRWGFIKWQQKKFSRLTYLELERLTEGFTQYNGEKL